MGTHAPVVAPGRFYLEIQYTFSEEDAATILRSTESTIEDQVVLFLDDLGIVAAVNVTHCTHITEALEDALDFARWVLERDTRETTIAIPEPWSVKVVSGEGMEFALLSRAEADLAEPPDDDDLVGASSGDPTD